MRHLYRGDLELTDSKRFPRLDGDQPAMIQPRVARLEHVERAAMRVHGDRLDLPLAPPPP